MQEFIEWVNDITYYVSLAIPLLFIGGFVKNSKAFKFFTLYLILVGIIQFLSWYSVKIEHVTSNLIYSHYYFILEFILLSFFYYYLIRNRIIFAVLILISGFLGYQYFSDPDLINRFNALGMTITHVLLVFYTMIYLYRRLASTGEFLIVTVGMFFYMISSSLVFAAGNLVFNVNISQDTIILLYGCNTVLYLIFQVLIIIEWWRNYKPSLIKRN